MRPDDTTAPADPADEPALEPTDEGLLDRWPSGHVAGPFDEDEVAELER